MKNPAKFGIFAALAISYCSIAVAQESRLIEEDGASGILVVPAKVPAPLIFVLHSARGSVMPADLEYAKVLAREGFVAFAINYKSGGPGATWVKTFEKLAQQQPEVANMPWGAIGFSAGGPLTFWMAAGAPRKFKAVVSYYGTYDFTTSPVSGMKSSSTKGSPLYMLDRFNVAALLLHGGKDTEVPVEMVERMKAAMGAKGMPVESVIYPNCFHAFDRGSEGFSDVTRNFTYLEYNDTCATDAQARTIAWFKTHLK